MSQLCRGGNCAAKGTDRSKNDEPERQKEVKERLSKREQKAERREVARRHSGQAG